MNGEKGSPAPLSEPLSEQPEDWENPGSPEQQFAYSRTRLRNEPVRQLRKPRGLAPLIDDSEVPEDTQDHWLDHISQDEGGSRFNVWNVLYDSFAVPIHWSRQLFSYIATSPGKLLTLTVILSIAIFAAGYSMSQSAGHRQASLDVLLSTTEPMSYSAHNLYTSLSLADTIATTGFVQAGVESADTRARYNAALDRASVAASESAASIPASDIDSMRLITEIQRQLPVYSGMVESARVNNRVGNPVGVAYMAEASFLMRDTILPAASDLFNATSQRVSDEQRSLTMPQWVPLSGLLAAVFFLSIAQWWLWRLTRRRLNKGFLAATALMLTAILWVSASNFATWQAGNRGFAEAAMPWDSLTTSRILAQQTRTAETLVLVRRQSLEETETTFTQTIDEVKVALEDFELAEKKTEQTHNDSILLQARESLQHWENAHQGLGTALDSGDYERAVILSTGTPQQNGGSPTAASAYGVLDSALAALISDARASMRAFINDGLAATKLVSTVVMLLSLAAVIAIWLGIRPRLREYL
ncbi:hypothetical protein COCCU_12370 [Corynebacterium occultum]|uniref:Four helix bundle sensory module for signal transduction n=1 Tax=Corynebacterium occultum TaxID=2675219 RepID=A0A6B8W4A3_9CORY|nr:hypothetical protein [Corynebacterium occultum]QGU08374.1 hypothetical protein COCCU_12370 [Corynebacterium occultum]